MPGSPDYALDSLIQELNALARLKGEALQIKELEEQAPQLLGLPAYARAPRSAEALYGDLRWVVESGLPSEHRLSAAITLRLADLHVFRDGERPHLVEGREIALARIEGWGRERITRERPLLLARVAFILFQLAGYRREYLRLTPSVPPAPSQGYLLHKVDLHIVELGDPQICSYHYELSVTRQQAGPSTLKYRVVLCEDIMLFGVAWLPQSTRGELGPADNAGLRTLTINLEHLPIGKPTMIEAAFLLAFPVTHPPAAGIVVDEPIEQAGINVFIQAGPVAVGIARWQTPVPALEQHEDILHTGVAAGSVENLEPHPHGGSWQVFADPQPGYVYGITWGNEPSYITTGRLLSFPKEFLGQYIDNR
jgi:hypothetical protein